METIYIGIDSGTQGTKAVLFDEKSGTTLKEAYAPHTLVEGASGKREQDPSQWVAACEIVLKGLFEDGTVSPKAVAAIGVSAQQHGCVVLDESGEVIRPAKLWCDTETHEEAEELTRNLGGPKGAIEVMGNSVAVGFTASKLLWMKRHEKDNYDKIASVLLPHDYLNYWLTGEKKTECGDASGTAYFDVRSRRWSDKVLNSMDSSGKLKSCLPQLIDSAGSVGGIRPEIADQFNLSRDVLVSSGGGDNMMAAIGTGNVSQGVVTASVGTSGTIYAFSEGPVVDARGEIAAFCSSDGHWLPLVCTMNATVSSELWRSVLELDIPAFNKHMIEAHPGSQGITVIPFYNGERTPALPNASASVHGIRSDNLNRSNLSRASVEGASYGLRYGLDALRREGINPTQIRLTGGGAKSPEWRKILANVFGCPVVCPEIMEAGALGAAMQAMWCYKNQNGGTVAMSDLAESFIHLDGSTAVEPQNELKSQYEEFYQDYLYLTKTLYSKELTEGVI